MSKKRSKAAERQRIKERWFYAGTSAFERVFPGARAKRFPEIDDPYICPLCEQPFPRTAIADRTLTFEDAPPKPYGGKPVALSCKSCNNSLGSSLDAPLSSLDSNEMSPCRLGINGVEVAAYQEIRSDGRFFAIPENQNNPRDHEQFFKGLDHAAAQPPGQHVQDGHSEATSCGSRMAEGGVHGRLRNVGLLIRLFASAAVVREQLRHPDEEIISRFKLENRVSPRTTRFILYVRRARRAKTDRLDATALLRQLMNAAAGDRRGWREVRVPSVDAEADRQLQREWETCKADRNRVRTRIHSLLSTQGVRVRLTRQCLDHLALVRVWNGRPLPAALIARLTREWTHHQQLEARRRALLDARRARVDDATDIVAVQVQHLTRLRGIGPNGALTLSTELFAWRGFTNGRQIGACVGLTPTPYCSDQRSREQGISRSGNRRVRALSVELAWKWLLWQPQSALNRWFHERFGQHRRARRIGIVALARKLLIALWRYLMTNTIPEGALVRARSITREVWPRSELVRVARDPAGARA